jgi:hypothetical protein
MEMPALAVWTAFDGLLSAVAPIGLAAASGTALVVDLDPAGPNYPGQASLADLVFDGPRRVDLVPARRGVAVLRNGGVEVSEAREVVDALVAGWPDLVFRVGTPAAASGIAPLVPVWPLLPGILAAQANDTCVYQQTGFAARPPGPGPLLPRLRPALLGALLNGTVVRKSRWITAWRQVWRLPWH